MVPETGTPPSGLSLDYHWDLMKLAFRVPGDRHMTTFIIKRDHVDEHLRDDVAPIKIRVVSDAHGNFPTKKNKRFRTSQCFIERFGDIVQFENHEAFIAHRCWLTKDDLVDKDTRFVGYVGGEGKPATECVITFHDKKHFGYLYPEDKL